MIEIADINAAIRAARQSDGGQQAGVLCRAITVVALEAALQTGAHDDLHHARVIFEMQSGTVALLEYALMEVVMVVDVEAPAAQLRDIDVEAGEGGGLGLPNDLSTRRVLIAHRDLCLGDAVDFLFVHVTFVPGERVSEIGVGLVRFRVQRALDLHVHVHVC